MHINLAELNEHFRAFDNLIDAEDDSTMHFNYQLLNLLLSIVPRGEMFIGKHGTGLMTLAEFTKIVEEAYESDQLKFLASSAALLDESIDFNRDAGGALILEKSASTTSANMMTDRNLRSAMQEDATSLVERFTTSYKVQSEENTPIQQMVEMFEYLVVEEQHTILGVSPDALKKIFDLLRDKIVEVKAEYDELDLQKE